MSSTFAPPTSSAASRDALESALAGLDLSWSVLGGLAFGAQPDEVSVDFIALHPQRGVALIDAAPGGGADAAERFRALLAAERFDERYPGRLPIIHLRLDADGAAEIEDRLEAAFARAPSLAVRDGRWVPALADLLTSEPAPLPASPPVPAPRPPVETTPRPEPAAAAFARAADQARRPQRRGPTLRPSRRRTGTLAAAIALLLGAGVGAAAVHWSGQADLLAYLQPAPDTGEVSLAGSNATPPTEAPPPAPAAAEPTAAPPVAAVPASPPPPAPVHQAAPSVPPKPVVTGEPAPPAAPPPSVAAIPLPPPEPPPPPIVKAPAPPQTAPAVAELPPVPIPSPKPEFTLPEPEPRAVAKAPEPAPRAVAKAPEPAPKAATPPRSQTAARPPEPAPTPRAEAAPLSPPEAPARSTETASRSRGPIPLRAGSSIPHGGPPIDATDLPPLEGSGPRTTEPPSQEASRRWEAPRATAGSGATTAPTPAAATSPECRPYVADTTITGSARPVSGLACRQPDGRWKLVTERPQ